MSVNRKLQSIHLFYLLIILVEIDRTLKKVAEGLNEFHVILDKLESATNQGHKEKMETELKKEIKKLQRFRDSIKGWLCTNDIKDKTPLLEARKSIESEMELFKIMEKEMKTKAFSKEGLQQPSKLDAKEASFTKIRDWINDSIDSLNIQNDFLPSNDSIFRERNLLFVSRLEQILRMLLLERLSIDEVNSIKDDVEWYVEANQELDFVYDNSLFEIFDLPENCDSDGQDRPGLYELPQTINDIDTSSSDTSDDIDETELSPLTSFSIPEPITPPTSQQLPSTTISEHVPVLNQNQIANSKPVLNFAAVASTLNTITPSKKSPPIPKPENPWQKTSPKNMGTHSPLLVQEKIYGELLDLISSKSSNDQISQEDSLNASFRNLPDSSDADKHRTWIPKQIHATPSYYPSHPAAQLVENPSIFERQELDTLFFIFYYQQNSYSQYLAARELKRQSWRFHKKYLTWFQRHEEPRRLTDDWEQGTYIYFDYEGDWCQRKKSEFTFEYRYLEDEETV